MTTSTPSPIDAVMILCALYGAFCTVLCLFGLAAEVVCKYLDRRDAGRLELPR